MSEKDANQQLAHAEDDDGEIRPGNRGIGFSFGVGGLGVWGRRF